MNLLIGSVFLLPPDSSKLLLGRIIVLLLFIVPHEPRKISVISMTRSGVVSFPCYFSPKQIWNENPFNGQTLAIAKPFLTWQVMFSTTLITVPLLSISRLQRLRMDLLCRSKWTIPIYSLSQKILDKMFHARPLVSTWVFCLILCLQTWICEK